MSLTQSDGIPLLLIQLGLELFIMFDSNPERFKCYLRLKEIEGDGVKDTEGIWREMEIEKGGG